MFFIFPTGELELSHMDKNIGNSYQVYQNKGFKENKGQSLKHYLLIKMKN